LPVFAAAYDAALSPDGTQIAFTGRLARTHMEGDTVLTEEFEDLFVAPAGGGTARRLTALEATRVGEASWSPDGQTIAFAADPDGNFDLYLISAEGGDLRTLVPGPTNDREPAWSPDGQWIAFTSDRSGPGATEVWRVGVSGGPYKQLTDNVNSSFSPAWSPDGQWIVFLSDRRTTTDLYVMTANGDGERALLVRDIAAEERDPAWSPDGRWIVFSANRERPIFDLYVIRPDGSELQRIFGGDSDTRFPVWRP
jgi:tol-pal system beta propeller repeat protein TolB